MMIVVIKSICNGTCKWNDDNGYHEQSSGKTISLNEKTGSSPIDFGSLSPLMRIPQRGDLLAYRLIEESPLWYSTTTSFRVGEVTSYNDLTLGIVLVPMPEYPIFTDMHQIKSPHYKEDGSLQIHYPSLIDVRLLKGSDLLETSLESSGREPKSHKAAPGIQWSNREVEPAQPSEKGNWSVSACNQTEQKINEKNAEIVEKNNNDGWREGTSGKNFIVESYKEMNKSTLSTSGKKGWS